MTRPLPFLPRLLGALLAGALLGDLALAQAPNTGAPRGSAASAPVSSPSYTTQKDISGFHPPPNQLATNPRSANAVSKGAPGAGANVPVLSASQAAAAASAAARAASRAARQTPRN